MKNVLIVCTSNKTRSPLAMEIANGIAERKKAPYRFKSGGRSEKGIETAHSPTHISSYNVEEFDAFHVMTQRQKITLCSYFKNKSIESKVTVLGVADPFGKGIEAYRRCRDQLAEFYEMYIK